MIRKTLLLTAGLLVSAFAFSQTANTLLWRISGKNSTKPSYLFGTMHILCPQDAVLSDSMKKVIGRCDEIYFEIDLSNMMGMALGAMKYMQMNDGKRLSDLLKPEEYDRVKTYFSQHGAMIPFGMLERFKPMLISGLIEEQALDCEATDGMELTIMKESRSHDKKINGLETLAFQAGLFDSIPYTEQAKELVNDVDSADQNKKATRKLVAAYKAQDLDKINELSEKDDEGVSGYMDLLLYKRNRSWAAKLDTLLPQKSLLIAVGAAHLPGKKGVIQLLRDAGYTVEPVENRIPNGQLVKD